jgi:hypothetical protein
MKLSTCIINSFYISSFSLFCLTARQTVLADEGEDAEHLCEHGKLFVADVNDGNVLHVFDIHDIGNVTEETKVTIKGSAGSNALYATANKQVVASLNYGSEATNFTDGNVEFIHAGVGKDDDGNITFEDPKVLTSVAFDCVAPTHFVTQNNKIGISCDGNFDKMINTTIWLIDELKLIPKTFGGNALYFNGTLPGSHHGYVVPMEDEEFVHSQATTARILRTEEGAMDELGDTVIVADPDGKVILSLNDTSSMSTHCSGHHGLATKHDTAIFACDVNHGGLLVVIYDDDKAGYVSSAVAYPSSHPGHRSFAIEEHSKSPFLIADLVVFNATTNMLSSFNLFAFEKNDTTVAESNVLKLETDQYPCAIQYEKLKGKVLLIFLADGTLSAYKFNSTWTMVSTVKVVENMSSCSNATFASGIEQAFVLTTTQNPTMYGIDLEEVYEGKEGTMTVTSSPLGFTPSSAVVAGTCPGSAAESDDDVAPEENPSTTTSAAIVWSTSTTTAAAVALVGSVVVYSMNFMVHLY